MLLEHLIVFRYKAIKEELIYMPPGLSGKMCVNLNIVFLEEAGAVLCLCAT